MQYNFIKDTAKELARTHRQAEIQRKRAILETEKALQQRQKPSKHNYLIQRLADVDEINAEIADWIYELQNILAHTLTTEKTILVDGLRLQETFPVMKAPQKLLVKSQIPKFHKPPSLPKWVMQLLPFLEKGYMKALKKAESNYQLANAKIIPTIAELKYDQSKDKIKGTTRNPIEIEELYQDIVAYITLRTIREVFIADMAQHLNIVVFNGFVQTVNAVTQKNTQTYLISVQVTKDIFKSLNFSIIDKLTCLRNLGAQISSPMTAM